MKLKECKPYHAKITQKFCDANQEVAQKVFFKLVAFPENGLKISDIPNIELDRFIHCGDCPENRLPLPVDIIIKKVHKHLHLSLLKIIEKVDNPTEEEEDDIQKIAQRF